MCVLISEQVQSTYLLPTLPT